jgi:hypothetical protein
LADYTKAKYDCQRLPPHGKVFSFFVDDQIYCVGVPRVHKLLDPLICLLISSVKLVERSILADEAGRIQAEHAFRLSMLERLLCVKAVWDFAMM